MTATHSLEACLTLRRGVLLAFANLAMAGSNRQPRAGYPDTRGCFSLTDEYARTAGCQQQIFASFAIIDMQDIDESPWDDSPSGGMTHAAETEWTRLSSGFQNVSFLLLPPTNRRTTSQTSRRQDIAKELPQGKKTLYKKGSIQAFHKQADRSDVNSDSSVGSQAHCTSTSTSPKLELKLELEPITSTTRNHHTQNQGQIREQIPQTAYERSLTLSRLYGLRISHHHHHHHHHHRWYTRRKRKDTLLIVLMI